MAKRARPPGGSLKALRPRFTTRYSFLAPSEPVPDKERRVSIVSSGGIGENLLMAPLLQAIRDHRPESIVTLYATHREPAELLVASGLADRAVAITREGPYHTHVIVPQDCAHLLVFANPSRDGQGRPTPSPLQQHYLSKLVGCRSTYAWSPPPGGAHAAAYALGAGAALGLYPEGLTMVVRSLTPPPVPAPEVPAGVVLIHPSSQWPIKAWPMDRYVRLAAEIEGAGYPVRFLHDGPSPTNRQRERLTSAPWLALSLAELATVMQGARLYIGNDSGPTHLAALMGTPTIALFGPSDPTVWQPIGTRVQVLRVCSAVQAENDPDWQVCTDPRCMRALPYDLVRDTTLGMLAAITREGIVSGPTHTPCCHTSHSFGGRHAST